MSKTGFPLGSINQIEIGRSKGFEIEAGELLKFFIVRVNEKAFYAYRNSCPHKGYEQGSMAWRKHHFLNGDGTLIQCGSHGALFEIETGLCIHGPCKNKLLDVVNVSCDDAGYLYLHVENGKNL